MAEGIVGIKSLVKRPTEIYLPLVCNKHAQCNILNPVLKTLISHP